MMLVVMLLTEQLMIGNLLHHLVTKGVFPTKVGGYSIDNPLGFKQFKALFQSTGLSLERFYSAV